MRGAGPLQDGAEPARGAALHAVGRPRRLQHPLHTDGLLGESRRRDLAARVRLRRRVGRPSGRQRVHRRHHAGQRRIRMRGEYSEHVSSYR